MISYVQNAFRQSGVIITRMNQVASIFHVHSILDKILFVSVIITYKVIERMVLHPLHLLVSNTIVLISKIHNKYIVL
jgi:hypothetical protein